MNEQVNLSRSERQRIQLQADILDAAFMEFSERGYHQTAIADIACITEGGEKARSSVL